MTTPERPDPTIVVDEDADLDDLHDHVAEMRALLLRWMTIWWLLIPFVPVATVYANHRENPIRGSAWIAYGFLAVVGLGFWIAFGLVGRRLRRVFAAQDHEADLARQGRRAERELKIRKAQRLERATARHAALVQRSEAEKARALAVDIDRLRQELDPDGERSAS